MGRTKSFNENEVLDVCACTFITYGYEGTSIDQIVSSTGLLRGSIYGSFGSKRGIFLAALKQTLTSKGQTPQILDMCLIALLELAPNDGEVKTVVEDFLTRTPQKNWQQILGKRLLAKAGVVVVTKE